MSARQRRVGVQTHLAEVRILLSCVAQTHIVTRTPSLETADEVPDALALALINGTPAALEGSIPLLFDFSQHFRVVAIDAPRRDQVEIISYIYTVMARDRVELVSFQWHPYGQGSIDFPHVHIGPAMSRPDSVVRAGEAHKIHVPTSEVSLADVLRFMITELEVEPRRDDWETILSRPSVGR